MRKNRRFALAFKRVFAFSALLIVVGFGSLSLLGDNGIFDLLKLRSMLRELQTENSALLEQQEELRSETLRLNELRHIEFLARERLGLMRPNEVFVILSEPSHQSAVDNKPLLQ